MIKMFYNKEILINSIWRGLQLFEKQGVLFLIFLITIKYLSPYDFGNYTLILSILFFLVLLSDFGVSTSITKYVSYYLSSKDEKLNLILFNSIIITVFVSLILTLFIIFFGKYLFLENKQYIYYLIPLLFLIPVTSLFDGMYRGMKKFKKLAILSFFAVIFSLPIIYFLIINYKIQGALISHNIFYLIYLLFLFTGYKFNISCKFDKSLIKKIGRYSFMVGLANLGYLLYNRVDIIILGHFGFINEIGYYEIINRIFLILLTPFVIIGQVIFPDMALLFSENKIRLLKNKFYNSLFIYFLLATFLSLIFYFTIPYLMNLFFIEYYDLTFMKIFNVSIFIFFILVLTTTINMGIITPTNYTKGIIFSVLFFGLFNVFFSIFLIKIFSFMGVIYATLISNILNTIVIYIIFIKNTFWRYNL